MSNIDLIADYVVLTEPQNYSQITTIAKSMEILTQEAIGQLGIDAKASMQGSAAKGTSFGNNADIDIFIQLPLDTSPDVFDRSASKLAEAMGFEHKLKQSGHPYVTFTYQGYDVDLVPCYEIESMHEMVSAVDRTPLHTAWFHANVSKEQQHEVRKLKAFMQGIDAYGADTLTQGISGYACEILIHEHDSFETFVMNGLPNELADPVDESRNVLSSISPEQWQAINTACQHYSEAPDIRFFRPSLHVDDVAMDKQLDNAAAMGYDVHDMKFHGSSDELASLRSEYRKLFRNAREYGCRVDDHYFVEDGDLTIVVISKPSASLRTASGPKPNDFDDINDYIEASEGFMLAHEDDLTTVEHDGQILAHFPEKFKTVSSYIEHYAPELHRKLYMHSTASKFYRFRAVLGGTPRWAC